MTHAEFNPSTLVISIVSHGQGQLIHFLLKDLQPILQMGASLILTLNLPEDESFISDYDCNIQVVRNESPKGYGENHNNANLLTDRYWFAVLNPDVRCNPFVFSTLAEEHEKMKAGVTSPHITNSYGQDEDSVRFYPTASRLLSRQACRFLGRRLTADYVHKDQKSIAVDWAAGMFLLFKTSDYRRIGGFDTRYFMYLEDADICLRLNSVGLPTIWVPSVSVIHDARRATSKSFRHLRWHLTSMVRFLFVAPWSNTRPPLN